MTLICVPSSFPVSPGGVSFYGTQCVFMNVNYTCAHMIHVIWEKIQNIQTLFIVLKQPTDGPSEHQLWVNPFSAYLLSRSPKSSHSNRWVSFCILCIAAWERWREREWVRLRICCDEQIVWYHVCYHQWTHVRLHYITDIVVSGGPSPSHYGEQQVTHHPTSHHPRFHLLTTPHGSWANHWWSLINGAATHNAFGNCKTEERVLVMSCDVIELQRSKYGDNRWSVISLSNIVKSDFKILQQFPTVINLRHLADSPRSTTFTWAALWG